MLFVKSFKNEKQVFYFDNRGNCYSLYNIVFLWCSIKRNLRKINGYNKYDICKCENDFIF